MKRAHGFTLIELVIVMAIMAIFLMLIVVSLRSSLANGRDSERASDIASLARGLESYREDGDPPRNVPPGNYPGMTEIDAAYNASPSYMRTGFLQGVPRSSFDAPGATTTKSFNYNSSLSGASSDPTIRQALSTTPYLYIPLTTLDNQCSSYTDCVKFKLYYLSEATDTVEVVYSRSQ